MPAQAKHNGGQMIVMKFGGTSVGNASRVRSVVRQVAARRAESPIVVVSAVGDVTDWLITIAKLASAGAPYAQRLETLEKLHHRIISALGLNRNLINPDIKQLRSQLRDVASSRKLTAKALDAIMAFGERATCKIVAQCMLRSGIPAGSYNSYDVGLTTDANFGSAEVLHSSYPAIKREMRKLGNQIPIITGFIGRTKGGDITTLGRGGSDYTASIIGAALNANEVQIWTDVDGMMTADPKIVRRAKTLDEASYDEAKELANLGAKVLHHKTLGPAIRKGIPVRIANSLNPSGHGTLISKDISKKQRIASITYSKSTDYLEANAPDSLRADRGDLTKISIVGKNMSTIPGELKKALSALKDIEIEMVLSNKSGISQSFVVKERHGARAIRQLHKEFFGA